MHTNKVRPRKYTRTIKYTVGKLFQTLQLRNQDPANLLQEKRKLQEAAMKNIPEKKNQERFKLAHRRTIKIAEERREAKRVEDRAEVR